MYVEHKIEVRFLCKSNTYEVISKEMHMLVTLRK
jgi:hypothetical protein